MNKETLESAALTLEIARTILPESLYREMMYMTFEWIADHYPREQGMIVGRRLGDVETAELEEIYAEA